MKISKYFSDTEFMSKDGDNSSTPFPKTIVSPKLLELLDKIREEIGVPVLVNSGYRSPTHNKAVGGVSNSQHVFGTAADITIKDKTKLKQLKEICDRLNPNGGVGLNYNTFVHVDVRGKRARW